MVATLFVESNFLLELVFQQEQDAACRKLVELARSRQVELRLPVFCLMEAVYTLDGRRKSRKELNRSLTAELGQYMRETAGQDDVPAMMSTLNTLLIERGDIQQNRFMAVVTELMAAGIQLLPLDAPVWQCLPAILSTTELQLGDALVYASVTNSLALSPPGSQALFVTRDTHFREPVIRQQLGEQGCALLFDFGAAAARVSSF